MCCDECGSSYFIDASAMSGLCAECAHRLYGYPKCEHTFVDGRCTKCGWNGSFSNYLRDLDSRSSL